MFLPIFQAETLTTVVLDYLFQDVCVDNSLERQRQCLPPEQRAGLLTVQQNKDNVSLWSNGDVCLLSKKIWVP